MFGESAGGNLAAVVCLLARDQREPRIIAQALVYPATDARLQADSLSTYAEGFIQRKADVEYAFRTYTQARRIAVRMGAFTPACG